MKNFNNIKKGLASLIDIYGLNSYGKMNIKSAKNALQSDWEKVGMDMRKAFIRFEHENMEKLENINKIKN